MHMCSSTISSQWLSSLFTGELLVHRETDTRSTRHCWLMVEAWPKTYGLVLYLVPLTIGCPVPETIRLPFLTEFRSTNQSSLRDLTNHRFEMTDWIRVLAWRSSISSNSVALPIPLSGQERKWYNVVEEEGRNARIIRTKRWKRNRVVVNITLFYDALARRRSSMH